MHHNNITPQRVSLIIHLNSLHTQSKKVNEYIFQIITRNTHQVITQMSPILFFMKNFADMCIFHSSSTKKSRPHPNRITLKSFIAPLSVASGLIMHQFYSFLLRRRCWCQRGSFLSIIIFGPYRFCTLPLDWWCIIKIII